MKRIYSKAMEPQLVTNPRHAQVLKELQDREPLFHRPELGTSRAGFEKMTDDAFWEVGASGRRYSREFVLSELEKRYAGEFADHWETGQFHCLELAFDTYLLTYTLRQGVRLTRRATIWRQTNEGWKAIYHQGTLVEQGLASLASDLLSHSENDAASNSP
jgi:hypothetical protein